jgi:RND family efflux transporter MFP subunit
MGSLPALALCLALVGCLGRSREPAGKDLPTVTVSYPVQREVTNYQDYTGRTAAVNSVQVQARVTGYLKEINFKEGAEVKEGKVLYEIDPSPYQAAFDAAKAQVAQNEANLELAKQNNTRAQALAKSAGTLPAIAKAELESNESLQKQALANLNFAKANLVTAKLNLDWTQVTAPVTGLVGRLLVTRGNLIVANQTTLTTVVSQDPMWVYLDIDEPTELAVRELCRQGQFGKFRGDELPPVPFRLQLTNEKDFPHPATLDFVNNQLDQATATYKIRATFRNPPPAYGPSLFTPNNFVRVRVPTSGPYQALLVSPEAVGTDQDLKYLYVVDENDKVVRRPVKLGPVHDGLQVVTEGLEAGERVIVTGLQRVQQDATVKARVVDMPIRARDSQPPPEPLQLKNLVPAPKK